jgi:ATP-dependent RNA helicase RhlE
LSLSNFRDLGVAEPLLQALLSEKHDTPTPIQAQAIPSILQGRDLLGIAQTGTGKTAAFALPILQRLSQNPGRPEAKSTRTLILAPTRELALQIAERTRAYGRNLGLKQMVVIGGVGMNPQIAGLARGVDILIATPGRLLDLMQQRHVKLDRVSHLVLDEVDRMLDMGFIRDVKRIVAATPHGRQTLVFSATLPVEIDRLAASFLKDPVRVQVSPATITVDRVDQRVHFVDAAGKRKLLTTLLADPAMERVIVFTRTKHGANRVAEHLDKAGVRAVAIHGNKSQNARQAALETFRVGRARVLVATDIAARGLDIADVTHVINFELPNVPEDYVHRIGRTARAGASGIALSFCAPDERAHLRGIEALTKRRIGAVETQADRGRRAAA